jgi:hypothetical protein
MHNLVFQLCVSAMAGWVNRGQQQVIEYLLEENRVLREQLGGRRLWLTGAQRRRLAVRAKALGRQALMGLACVVTPDTLLRWYRRPTPGPPPTRARSSRRRAPVHPAIDPGSRCGSHCGRRSFPATQGAEWLIRARKGQEPVQLLRNFSFPFSMASIIVRGRSSSGCSAA